MFSVNENRVRPFLFGLAIFLIALWPVRGFALTEISNVRYWTAPDQTRIVFDLSAEPDYSFKIEKNIITLEFSNASFSALLPAEKSSENPASAKSLLQLQRMINVKLKFS